MSSPFCFLRLPRDPNPKGPPPKGLPPNIPPNKSPNMSAGNPITENTDKDIKSQCQATVQLMKYVRTGLLPVKHDRKALPFFLPVNSFQLYDGVTSNQMIAKK